MVEPSEIKLAISHLKLPHKLKNVRLKWDILSMSINDWCHSMDASADFYQFTVGSMDHHDLPYWERFRCKESHRFSDVLRKVESDGLENKWMSHSYKDIETWPEQLRQSIDFSALGIENAQDVLFWFGTKGANTPCHYDTYGFNIVVQVFGRKSWLLFPPESKFHCTRVPYEESSVYCKENFYSPSDMSQFEEIGRDGDAYEVTLEPGEILFVPPKWWHYVENLETSLTVNTWIPLGDEDAYARLEECFVRTQIEKITESAECNDLDALKSYIFNPNESFAAELNLLNLFKPLADVILENMDKSKDLKAVNAQAKHAQHIVEQNSSVFVQIDPINCARFIEILRSNGRRFNEALRKRSNVDGCHLEIENVINALCHPKTVRSACDLYLNEIQECNRKR